MSASVTIKLQDPVKWTEKEEPVTELTLRPTAKFFRDVVLDTNAAGGIKLEPYALAVVGVRMAGRPAAETFVDKMSPADMMEVTRVVAGFLAPNLETGGEPSP